MEMTNTSSLQLTMCQQTALNDIIEFANDKDKTLFTLTGAAGTGKTTMISVVMSNIKYTFGVIVSAPTHKARLVISEKTNIVSETVQSLLGLAPDVEIENYDINNPIFKQKSEPKLPFYKFIALDEGSMLNEGAFEAIRKLALKSKTKILFIGDTFQLPPVKEENSTVFKLQNPEIEDWIGVEGITKLRTQVRQKPDNPLSIILILLRLQIAQLLHDELEIEILERDFKIAKETFGLTDVKVSRENAFKDWITRVPTAMTNTGKGYQIIRNVETFKDIIAQDFTTDSKSAKALAFTNEKVSEYNKFIRQTLFNTDELLVKGDILLCYKTMRRDKENICINSEEYEVTTLRESEGYGIPTYEIMIKPLRGGFEEEINIVKDDYKAFILKHEEMHSKARDNRNYWGSYYGFKNNFLLMEALNIKYKKDVLPDGVRHVQYRNLPGKDFDYGFAFTIHKSQGSTIPNIYVDGKDISKIMSFPDIDLHVKRLFFFRMLYTAISRASNKAVIYF